MMARWPRAETPQGVTGSQEREENTMKNITALRAKWLDYQPSTGWQRLYRAAALCIIDAASKEYAAPGATIAHRIRTVGNMLADRGESAGSVRAAEAYHFAVGLLERDADGGTPA